MSADSGARRIRSATPADLRAIVAIETAAFDLARRSSPASLRRALRSRFQRVLVLEVAGAIAGYVVLWPFRRTWRVYNLASHPGYRNQGVGGALLDAAIGQAERAGALRLVLESRDEPTLLRFYRQRGLQPYRQLPDYYAPGEPALRMRRQLQLPP